MTEILQKFVAFSEYMYFKKPLLLKVLSHIFGPNFLTLQLCVILIFHYPIKLNFKDFSLKTAKSTNFLFDRYGTK